MLSDEMPLWDFTDRNPSPVGYIGTNVVDETTHKIRNICWRPFIPAKEQRIPAKEQMMVMLIG